MRAHFKSPLHLVETNGRDRYRQLPATDVLESVEMRLDATGSESRSEPEVLDEPQLNESERVKV
jgi:hypothetical protein